MSFVTWTPARAVSLIASAVLVACGGGGGGESESSGGTFGTGSDGRSATSATPTINTQPESVSVLTDATATFSVAASNSLSYQWQRNGVAIAGATAASYTTAPVTYQDDGAQYSVVVSNAAGSTTSNAAQLKLKLSANQQIFEDLILGPNGSSHQFIWNLSYSGPQLNGTNYAMTDYAVLDQSPLTHGPQTDTQSARVNLTTTLAMQSLAPTRVLKNGSILVAPSGQGKQTVSYVGSDVQIDTLASDATTVAFSQIRTDYSVIALSGTLAGSTDDFAHYHNSFFSNAGVLTPGATYSSGAAYVKYTAINHGDRYTAFDCGATTTDSNISACVTSTTLDAALTAGIHSNSDGVTYHLGDGATSGVDGVSVWVATNPRPISATLSTTVQYRVYFQLNGNVYTGALIKDGTVLGGSYYVSNPGAPVVTDRLTFLPFNLRMNKAARDSVAAAMAI